MKGILKRLLFALLVFGMLSFCSVYIAVILNDVFAVHTVQIRKFAQCIQLIRESEKCFKWWGLLELLSLSMAALVFFIRHDYYTSKMKKVTNDISIPEACGQGQYGTAHFMTKREIRKRYKPLVIKKNDPLITELMETGDKIKQDVKQFDKDEKAAERQRKRLEKKLKREERKQDKKQEKEHKQTAKPPNIIMAIINKPRTKVFGALSLLRQKKRHCITLCKWFAQDRLYCLHSLWAVRTAKIFCNGLAEIKYRKRALKLQNPPPAADFSKPYFKKAGLVVHTNKDGSKISCITEDRHTLIIGSTGAGKSRRMVIPTVCTLGLAGESMVITDPKGEVYAYTFKFLKKQGYDVIKMDFFNPLLSSRINPLQPVIDAVKEGNLSLASTRAWDITSFLVEKNDKTEPIWKNGEASIIAAAIMCVVYDNINKPQYQNLTNVYEFIANMCKDVKEGNASYKPITRYVEGLPDNHPAKSLLGISNVAPDRTAGSFYTSALTSLKLFTSEDIYNITKESEFTFNNLGSKKQAFFFVLPDSKTTYYPIVSLFCSQIYDTLTECAKKNGNLLDRRVNFVLDEFGNFAKITDFETKLTVGRGYGIRFNMFVQSFAQLEAKYEKTGETTIKDNCIWIYMSAGTNETNKEFEERLGKYTTSGYSLGNDTKRNAQPSASSNVSLMGRSLLEATEIGRISKPYLLVSEQQADPVMFYLPDLSKWKYNRMLGLGDIDHNKAYMKYVEANQALCIQEEVQLWRIWDRYIPGLNITERNYEYENQTYGGHSFE